MISDLSYLDQIDNIEQCVAVLIMYMYKYTHLQCVIEINTILCAYQPLIIQHSDPESLFSRRSRARNMRQLKLRCGFLLILSF
jgi:hypothetical protein